MVLDLRRVYGLTCQSSFSLLSPAPRHPTPPPTTSVRFLRGRSTTSPSCRWCSCWFSAPLECILYPTWRWSFLCSWSCSSLSGTQHKHTRTHICTHVNVHNWRIFLMYFVASVKIQILLLRPQNHNHHHYHHHEQQILVHNKWNMNLYRIIQHTLLHCCTQCWERSGWIM